MKSSWKWAQSLPGRWHPSEDQDDDSLRSAWIHLEVEIHHARPVAPPASREEGQEFHEKCPSSSGENSNAAEGACGAENNTNEIPEGLPSHLQHCSEASP